MDVFKLYDNYGGHGYIGEEITQLEHATQCAFLAEEFCKNNKCFCEIDLILGSFLHDIGHLLIYDNKNLKTMGNFGVSNHEDLGANYLKSKGFSENICEFARNHIKTKRYLITKNPDYYNNLSEASKNTFKYQGGKLTQNEIKEFENDKLFKYHLKIREFDDKAKSTDTVLLKKIKELNAPNYYYNLYKSNYN